MFCHLSDLLGKNGKATSNFTSIKIVKLKKKSQPLSSNFIIKHSFLISITQEYGSYYSYYYLSFNPISFKYLLKCHPIGEASSDHSHSSPSLPGLTYIYSFFKPQHLPP